MIPRSKYYGEGRVAFNVVPAAFGVATAEINIAPESLDDFMNVYSRQGDEFREWAH